MTTSHFQLNGREEVARFEASVSAYLSLRTPLDANHVSLVAAYDFCLRRADGGKLFAAILDVFINFSIIRCELNDVIAAWGRRDAHRKIESNRILESTNTFQAAMDVQRYTSSFTYRYRALWDKLMGLLILLYAPESYESFSSSKSRKKVFARIVRDKNLLTEENKKALSLMLEWFDNEFRTPEAHGTGTLRKWSFAVLIPREDPTQKLIMYWNLMNDVVARLGAKFAEQDV